MSTLQKVPVLGGEFLQGVLQAVIDHTEQPWTQGCGQHASRQLDTVTHGDAVSFLEHLQVGQASLDAQNLRFQSSVAHTNIGHLVLHKLALGHFYRDDAPVHFPDECFIGRYCDAHRQPPG